MAFVDFREWDAQSFGSPLQSSAVVVITWRFGYVSFISIAAVTSAHGSGHVGSLTQRCPTATLLFVLINDIIELN